MAVEEGDHVKVEYLGRLKDGTIFDSSIEKKAKESDFYDEDREYEPIGFTVGKGEVIPGFEEGVLGMEIGEKREIEIPPEEAYGDAGDHPLSGKTLIFEIEVKEIR